MVYLKGLWVVCFVYKRYTLQLVVVTDCEVLLLGIQNNEYHYVESQSMVCEYV